MKTFILFDAARKFRIIAADCMEEAIKKVPEFTNPKCDATHAWQWFTDGDRSYALELFEEEK